MRINFLKTCFKLQGADDFGEAINEVIDTSADKEFNEMIKNDIINFPNVLMLNDLKTRVFGDRVYVEIEIAVDANITVKEGHDIALGLHDFLENKYSIIKHCMIHIDPME